jgi:RNA polymerase sigma-70 factor (ECF subfamily)
MERYMPETDFTLLNAIQANKTKDAAFERLLSKYERLVYYIARKYFPHAEDAMDASQESVIRIYKGLPKVTLPESGSLKGWICTVTANTCLDLLRKRRPATEPLPERDVLYITMESAEETTVARERARTVLDAVSKLPENYRTMIILRDMNGLSYQELAEATGVSEGTVKSRLSRARAALKDMI